MTAELHCADPAPRRRKTREQGLNAIDYVEVGEDPRILTVAFVDEPRNVSLENVRVDGGRRVGNLRVIELRDGQVDGIDYCVTVRLDRAGDASTYTLSVVEADERGRPGTDPREGFDARYASIEFSFATGCPSDLDCAEIDVCPPETFPEPEISYLAKDYAGFRQLILDRLALLVPDWRERHVPDLQLTLVELLAYVGDHLSYYQDAVATEAYLATARRRVSVRRHLRLVDYRLHEGCNARAWVAVEVTGDLTLEPKDVFFLTAPPGSSQRRPALRPDDLRRLPVGSYEVFEPMSDAPVTFRQAHNAIELWTWGESECCLPAGATAATLKDGEIEAEDGYSDVAVERTEYEEYDEKSSEQRENGHPTRSLSLAPGDVLVFEEVKGPRTGAAADADVTHRQAVRLTRVTPAYDDVEEQPVVEVEWAADDALRFPLCLSTVGPDCEHVYGVSVARGNVVLVDHGRSISRCGGAKEPVEIPAAPIPDPGCDPCAAPEARRLLTALLPQLQAQRPLTRAQLQLVVELLGEREASELGLRPDEEENDTDEKRTTRAAAQALALDKALVFREPFPVPFFTALQRHPLTHRAPFPRPEIVAASQAERLEEKAVGVRAQAQATRDRVEDLWRKTYAGDELSFGDLNWLDAAFGAAALRSSGVIPPMGSKQKLAQGKAAARALLRLLERWSVARDRDLGRLDALARRARSGYVLRAEEVVELEDTWESVEGFFVDSSRGAFAGPACTAMEQDPRDALAVLTLEEAEESVGSRSDEEHGAEGLWEVRADLLESVSVDRHVVVEVADDGVARVRFGDGDCGSAPRPGTTLLADYRVGNGTAGNVGAEVISRIVLCTTEQSEITRVRNPLAACGGVDPEPVHEARQLAPAVLRQRLLRAVTADDYASLASQPPLQRAAASLRWTGSWYEANVALDPFGVKAASPKLLRAVEDRLGPFRRIGHDLRIVEADEVPLDLSLSVCVLPHYHRGEVARAIRDALSSRTTASGKGFFHPDRMTFGTDVALSAIVAVVQAVPGVESVEVSRFERLGEGDRGELGTGSIALGPLEIARLDNDPAHPGHGKLALELRGGR